jgi:hypothetical protein
MADRIAGKTRRKHLMMRIGTVLSIATALGSMAINPSHAATANLNHNSTNLSSTKWPQGWGITGGKYGAFDCPTCHIPDTSNIKWIRPTITVLGNFSSTGTNNVPVTFKNVTSMGHDNRTPNTSSKNICEVCHSRNKHHNYNATRNATFGGDLTHNNGADCTAICHPHDAGFKPSGGDCLGCHNATQNAGISGYTRRQVVTNGGTGGDFIKLSRHVSDGSANQIVTKWDCIVCHMEGSTTDGNTSAYHHGASDATGLINLRNVDTPTTGWAIDNRAMTETYRGYMDTFCLTCHDSDGAAGINVNATNSGVNLSNARALTPFNTVDNLRNGRDAFTTRTRVTDVKSQMTVGNPSQHAVLGARYATNNASWTAAAWTANATRKGQILNNSTVRETATLHCSDCHLCETNAHGATNAWHMSLDGTVNNYTNDTVMTGTSYGTATLCAKCHNGYTAAGNSSRFDHSQDGHWEGYAFGSAGAKLGPVCLLCHAGDGFGHIHGRGSATDGDNTQYNPANNSTNGTYTKYRFMPGAWMQVQVGPNKGDADWNSTGAQTCYFNTVSTWSGCSQHSTGSVSKWTTTYGRATTY